MARDMLRTLFLPSLSARPPRTKAPAIIPRQTINPGRRGKRGERVGRRQGSQDHAMFQNMQHPFLCILETPLHRHQRWNGTDVFGKLEVLYKFNFLEHNSKKIVSPVCTCVHISQLINHNWVSCTSLKGYSLRCIICGTRKCCHFIFKAKK